SEFRCAGPGMRCSTVLCLRSQIGAAAAGLARALLTSAPATRLAERAPIGYITPTNRPLRGARMVANDAPHWFPDHREGEPPSPALAAQRPGPPLSGRDRGGGAPRGGRAARAGRSAREPSPPRPGPCHRQGAGPNEI